MFQEEVAVQPHSFPHAVTSAFAWAGVTFSNGCGPCNAMLAFGVFVNEPRKMEDVTQCGGR